MATNDDIAVTWSEYRLAPGYFAATYETPPSKIGSIIIPGTSKRPKDEATVVALGDPKYDHNGLLRTCFAKVGDRILVNAAYGRPYVYYTTEDGRPVEHKIYIFGFDDVIAVVK